MKLHRRDFLKASGGLIVSFSLRAQGPLQGSPALNQLDSWIAIAADGSITKLECSGTGVQVTYTASGQSSSPFGPLLGGSGTITTAGTAAAAYSVGGGICALCVIGDVNTNNTDFTVTGGDIYVDGNVSTGPNSNWTATNSITISGTVSGLSQANANPVYAARFTHLTTREQNKLTATQAQAVIAAAILRQLHAVITTGHAWDPVIATQGTARHAVMPIAA